MFAYVHSDDDTLMIYTFTEYVCLNWTKSEAELLSDSCTRSPVFVSCLESVYSTHIQHSQLSGSNGREQQPFCCSNHLKVSVQ